MFSSMDAYAPFKVQMCMACSTVMRWLGPHSHPATHFEAEMRPGTYKRIRLTAANGFKVIGFIEDCGCHMNPAGGIARRTWLLNQLQTNYPTTPVVLLDSGNFSDNPTEAGELRTATLLQSMKKLGYRAVNVGERDAISGRSLRCISWRTSTCEARCLIRTLWCHSAKCPSNNCRSDMIRTGTWNSFVELEIYDSWSI
jgi:hypothetical protein